MPGDTDDTDETEPCALRRGEVAVLVRGGFVLPDGRVFGSRDRCDFQQGSLLRLHYDETDGTYNTVLTGRNRRKEESPKEIPMEPPVESPASTEPEPLLASHGESADMSQFGGLMDSMGDNPWAPLVLVVLAVVTVLGGRQGWKFYSERSAQNHELEMRKLDIQAQTAGLNGAQPPPCASKTAEQEARLAAMENRLSGIERKQMSMPDLDPDAIDNLNKRLKKLEKSATSRPKPTT